MAVVANIGRGGGDNDTVSVIDLQARPPRVVETFTVGQTPEGIKLSPDGKLCGGRGHERQQQGQGLALLQRRGQAPALPGGRHAARPGWPRRGSATGRRAWPSRPTTGRSWWATWWSSEVQVLRWDGVGAAGHRASASRRTAAPPPCAPSDTPVRARSERGLRPRSPSGGRFGKGREPPSELMSVGGGLAAEQHGAGRALPRPGGGGQQQGRHAITGHGLREEIALAPVAAELLELGRAGRRSRCPPR